MSRKRTAVAALIERYYGREQDPHYLGYFDCFNQQRYYEAHDVLEQLWLARAEGANYSFYKGLIQLAGAFVHLQKQRLRPAAALFTLAETNLRKYPEIHEELDVKATLELIRAWRQRVEEGRFETNPLGPGHAPELRLRAGPGSLGRSPRRA